MRAIKNPYQAQAPRCEVCGTDLGKGNCRTCKLTRLNVAVAELKTELAGTPEKLTDNQVAAREDWMRIAVAYAAAYEPKDQPNEFLANIQVAWRNNRSLSLGQMRGVLNVIRHEARQNQAWNNPPQVYTKVKTVKLHPVEDGYYTVSFENDRHITIRLRTKGGKQFVAYLAGPTNTKDYRTFGIVEGTNLRLFRYERKNGQAFRPVNADSFKRQIAAVETLMGAKDVTEFGRAYAKASKNCYRCNRLLTDPESIESGIGPICAGRE